MRSETWCDYQITTSSSQGLVRTWRTSNWDRSASRSGWELPIDWSYLLQCESMMSSASSCSAHAQMTLYQVSRHLHRLLLSQKMRKNTERLMTSLTLDNTVNSFNTRSNGTVLTRIMSGTMLTRVNLTGQLTSWQSFTGNTQTSHNRLRLFWNLFSQYFTLLESSQWSFWGSWDLFSQYSLRRGGSVSPEEASLAWLKCTKGVWSIGFYSYAQGLTDDLDRRTQAVLLEVGFWRGRTVSSSVADNAFLKGGVMLGVWQRLA